MDMATRRRKAALRDYIDRNDGAAAVARAIGVERSYLSQLQSDDHPFGERAARRLEQKLGLPDMALDGKSAEPGADMELDDDEAGGPGAECYLVPMWVFRLGKRDSLLVLKALGGRLSDKEAQEAKDLGDRLTRQRANAARDLQAGTERAEAGIKAK